MKKVIFAIFLSALFFLSLFPLSARAESYYSNGPVENTSGTWSNILFFRHFNITRDGRITGYIENKSGREVRGLVLDAYTMDTDETRVFWRTTLDIGNLAPGGRYAVNKPYSPAPFDQNKILFRFKIHGSDEYHVPEINN